MNEAPKNCEDCPIVPQYEWGCVDCKAAKVVDHDYTPGPNCPFVRIAEYQDQQDRLTKCVADQASKLIEKDSELTAEHDKYLQAVADLAKQDEEIEAQRLRIIEVCECKQAEAEYLAKDAERDELSRGTTDVISERRRQIEEEGWDSAHDDSHRAGTLSDAGACYAMCGYQHTVPSVWPFDPTWWKPGGRLGRRKDLVKAAALIIAEIDRMDRKALGDKDA